MSSLHSIWLLYRWSRNKLGQVFTFFSSSLQKCSQSLFLLNLIWSFGVSFFYIKNDQSLSSSKWLNTCKSNIDLCNDFYVLNFKAELIVAMRFQIGKWFNMPTNIHSENVKEKLILINYIWSHPKIPPFHKMQSLQS